MNKRKRMKMKAIDIIFKRKMTKYECWFVMMADAWESEPYLYEEEKTKGAKK